MKSESKNYLTHAMSEGYYVQALALVSTYYFCKDVRDHVCRLF
jgi:hypothetical protein